MCEEGWSLFLHNRVVDSGQGNPKTKECLFMFDGKGVVSNTSRAEVETVLKLRCHEYLRNCPTASPSLCCFQRGMSWWCLRHQTTAGSRWFGTSTTSGATPSACPRRRGCSRGGRYSTCICLLSMPVGPDGHWLMPGSCFACGFLECPFECSCLFSTLLILNAELVSILVWIWICTGCTISSD